MENPRFVDEEGKGKKKAFGKKKDGKADKKDKGYVMFEEENSEGESLVNTDDREGKTPMKLKKHSKPSFKFVKKEKSYKPKEKEKEEKKKDEKKKDEKLKFKKKRHPPEGQATAVNEKPIFGVPLPVALARNKSYDGVQLPAIFRECIDYVEEFGLQCEGIYRISGVKSKVQALKDAYNKGLPVYLQEYEPNVVAGLLKQFLRELPEPVLTTHLMQKFEQASTMKNVKQRVGEFQRLIEELPTCNRLLLSWVIVHMTHVIAKEKQNKMSVQNVSIVLSPTMQISHRVLNVLFSASKILFRDTVIHKYVPPLKPVTSRWSLDLPESPTSLEEELRKQEILLDELHREVMRVKDTAKEEQLWEVQRVVTGLKRKLKMIKKGQSYSPGANRITINERAIDVKPEPPKKLNLKLGGDDLDLRRADSLSYMTSQQKAMASPQQAPVKVPSGKSEMLQAPGPKASTASAAASAKKVGGLRPVGTPTKDSGMDIGEIEMDIGARSHSQKQRPDNTKPQINAVEKLETEAKIEPIKPIDETTTEKANKQVKSSPDHSDKSESKEIISERADIDTCQTTDNKEDRPGKDEDSLSKPDSEPEKITHKRNESDEPGSKLELEVESSRDETQKAHAAVSDSEAVVKPKILMPKALAQPASLKELTVPNSSPANYIDDVPVSRKTPEVYLEPSAPPAAEGFESETGEPQTQASGVEPEVVIPEQRETVRSLSIDSGVAPEKLAAALSDLVIQKEAAEEAEMQEPEIEETEEELNQRIMSQFVADFGIERPEECDEEYEQLLEEYQTLLLEEEELRIIGDELRKKIDCEQYEAERLDEELVEIRAMREDLYSSEDDNSETSSDDSDNDDDDHLTAVLEQLTRDNQALQEQNRDLTEKIDQEVQDCLRTKVQIRLLQHQQLESSRNNELDLLL